MRCILYSGPKPLHRLVVMADLGCQLNTSGKKEANEELSPSEWPMNKLVAHTARVGIHAPPSIRGGFSFLVSYCS